MVDKYKLSEGTLMDIMRGAVLDDCIMQVLGVKKITTNSDKERYRLLLSDGKYIISYAMLSTQVTNGEITAFSIIKIKKYITSVLGNSGKSDKRILVIMEMELLVSGEEVNQKIGSPEQLPDDKGVPSSGSTITTQNSMNTPKPNMSGNNMPAIKPSVPQNGHNSIDNQLIHPINSLSPYQNRWVIRAKVQLKSPMRTWSNSKGDGNLFNFDLIDESGEIRVTAFRDTADKFFDIIEVDKVYYISKAAIKVANKQFNALKNDYEMTLNNDSVVQECNDVVDSIPETKYDFMGIDKLANIESGTLVDVIGVCKEVSDIVTFQAKSTGRELKKRTLTLMDETLNSIELTLWGTQAESFDGSSQPVIVLKRAKVGEFGGGKNISVLQSTVMKINPDLSEAHKLKGWYDNDGINSNAISVSTRTGMGSSSTKWMSFRDVVSEGLGNSDKGDYYQCVATILLVRGENCVYKACPSDNCNKKVVDMENGMYRCEKCNREYPNFKYRLLTSMNLADWSGNQWVNVFANEAEQILGATSEQVGQSSTEELDGIIEAANFKTFMFRLRAKMETYNDETRLKTIVVKVDPVNYQQYNSYLLSKMDNAI